MIGDSPIAQPRRVEILTTRGQTSWPTWLMVHEWEDVFAEILDAELVPVEKGMDTPALRLAPGDYQLLFLPLAKELQYYRHNRFLIPIVLDVWRDDIPLFIADATAFRLVFVTSLEIFQELRRQGCRNVAYLPFSVPGRYLRGSVPAKDIDVIQFGRKNVLLDAWMQKCLENRPDLLYITTREQDGQIWFHSSRDGFLFPSSSRQRFMEMLGRSRVSLVSTAGMDGGKSTGGINPVSPRFFESAAGYCHLIGRFPMNEEFVLFGVTDLAVQVNSYEEFQLALDNGLATPFARVHEFRTFLERNTTEQRAIQCAASVAALLQGNIFW